MDWLRIDYNIDPSGSGSSSIKRIPIASAWPRFVTSKGFYHLWDDLRAAYPRLMIDDCASGGRRIDLETMSRSLPLWRQRQYLRHAGPETGDRCVGRAKEPNDDRRLSRYVPFSACGQMGSSPYLFRSGLNAGNQFGEDCRPAGYPREQLKQAIAEAKRLRPYFFGDFYAIGPVTVRPEDWCVLQYHRPREQDGMVMAFRRDASPDAVHTVQTPRDRSGGRLRSDAVLRLRAIRAEASEGRGPWFAEVARHHQRETGIGGDRVQEGKTAGVTRGGQPIPCHSWKGTEEIVGTKLSKMDTFPDNLLRPSWTRRSAIM